jgi:hypothetical protein
LSPTRSRDSAIVRLARPRRISDAEAIADRVGRWRDQVRQLPKPSIGCLAPIGVERDSHRWQLG